MLTPRPFVIVTVPGWPVVVIPPPAADAEIVFTTLITDVELVVVGDTVNVAVAIVPLEIVVEFMP
jgi:hypothetical protein